MNAKPPKDLDSRLRYLAERMREEFEIVKRQGFPSRKEFSRYSRRCDALMTQPKWFGWINDLGIDYYELESLLKILKKEGLLENYDFVNEFM